MGLVATVVCAIASEFLSDHDSGVFDFDLDEIVSESGFDLGEELELPELLFASVVAGSDLGEVGLLGVIGAGSVADVVLDHLLVDGEDAVVHELDAEGAVDAIDLLGLNEFGHGGGSLNELAGGDIRNLI